MLFHPEKYGTETSFGMIEHMTRTVSIITAALLAVGLAFTLTSSESSLTDANTSQGTDTADSLQIITEAQERLIHATLEYETKFTTQKRDSAIHITPEMGALYEEIQYRISEMKKGKPLPVWVTPRTDFTDQQTMNDFNNEMDAYLTDTRKMYQTWHELIQNQLKDQFMTETPEERMKRIQDNTNTHVPYIVTSDPECRSGEVVVSCYKPGATHVTLTPEVFNGLECALRRTYAHEITHYMQGKNPNFVSQMETNRQALEDEAISNEHILGC